LQKESTTHEDEADEVEQHIYSDEDAIIRTPRSTRPAKTPLRRKEKHGTADDDDLGPAGLLPGLGTMFQPAVDWLSDDRRLEYDRWKKTILRQAAAAK
jgi:origin recognition complex subunit 6